MNILLLCNKPAANTNANTIIEHIGAFSKYSSQNVIEFNPISGRKPKLKNIDVIIVHYSLVACMAYYLPASIRREISNFSGIKVMFIQDEYRHVNSTIDVINALGINILFTCVPDSEIEKVYPAHLLPGVKKVNNLTGYVSEEFKTVSAPSYNERTIDVSYRSRDVPAWLGRLAKEKIDIAQKFPIYAKKFNLKTDIDCTEHGRLYGNQWTALLKNSKACLGTESGASVFDFTGEIQKNVEQHVLKNPSATFSELERLYFADEEGKIYLNQISPRCFEYAAYRTLMVLFEGEYSGILQPGVHYVPLKKDFSNIEEVCEKIKDEKLWAEMTERAYVDVIASGKYSYKKFIENVMVEIDAHEKSTTHQNSKIILHPPIKTLVYRLKRFSFTLKKSIKINLVRTFVLTNAVLRKVLSLRVYDYLKHVYRVLSYNFVNRLYDKLPNASLIERMENALNTDLQGDQRQLFHVDTNGSVVFCLRAHDLCEGKQPEYKEHVSYRDLNLEKEKHNKEYEEKVCNICKYYVW